jgi:hypothetical protein
VPTASDEMRDFAKQRNELLLELVSCAIAAAALWAIAGRLDGMLPEVKGLFVAVTLLFGGALARLVPQVIPVLSFRCPRCTLLFHAATQPARARPVLGLRACAHCGLRVPGADSPPV